MEDITGTFANVWSKVVLTYKEDWKEHIVETEDGGLDSFPTRFFSESDLETEFLCLLRREFRSERFKNKKVSVRNQFRFGYTTFRDQPELAIRIKKLYMELKKEIGKSSFIPDLALDVEDKDDNDSFLIFSEVKFWTDLVPDYNSREDMPSKYQKEIKRLRTQCQILELARDERVCENGYICIISDGYASGNVMKQVLDSVKKEFPKLHFLIDGMPLGEKKEILKLKLKDNGDRSKYK